MNKFFIISITCVLVFGACLKRNAGESVSSSENTTNAADIHNSRISVDWQGTYRGTIPAADGPGIDVKLVLNDNETYSIGYTYIDKGDSVFEESGKFKWTKDGGTVVLDTEDLPPYYKVGEGRLIQLDGEGNVITGMLENNYVLMKQVP